MSTQVKNRFLVSAGLAFFLTHTMQIGIGVLGYERYIAKDAGYDAWISIIITGLSIHIILWMMYSMMNKENGDLIAIHRRVFGKWVGGALSFFFVIYFLTLGITVLRSYIETVQAWMFPNLNMTLFLLVFLTLIYYTVSGGFRVVTGVAFFGVLLPSFLLFFLYFPFRYGQWDFLQPVLNHSPKEIFASSKVAVLEYIGFEVLLIIYPFIKNPEKSQKWAQLGILFSTFIYVMVAIASFVYFSEEQLERKIWATLSMFKIVEFPFVERFEYIAIATWILIIFPNICIALWCSSRAMKQLVPISQRKLLIGMIIISFAVNLYLRDRQLIDVFITTISQAGLYILYVYIPILFILFHLKFRRSS
ncbi:GerAB/ArcD/ProY family transporter [Pseudalkalibacillus berkeleyi]|uniref:Spore germination protein n=1 Tax=Pseudalkalibacillus berkeleyi TaxID=1069813 RepID=A0ABS9H5J0_9BACL|nr:GerAB/ArcD/ProY family transporter [Pseudalkalibacillus berkeleyi]MCF6139381.1 spore germination protein [Pseudalkalibacillus berkeleyi]